MTPASDEQTRGVILDVVLDLLEVGGYEAVRLREVAKRARLSLSTIYGLFPTRDELIASALERWMDANVFADLAMPEPGETLRETGAPWTTRPRHRTPAHGSAMRLVTGHRPEAMATAPM